MLDSADCALLIGDPALSIKDGTDYRKFDLVEVWKKFTGFGFVFAMWMTHQGELDIDFAAARDEGVSHLEDIIGNYADDIALTSEELRDYLSLNISFKVDESMQNGLNLFFELAEKHGLIESNRSLRFCD